MWDLGFSFVTNFSGFLYIDILHKIRYNIVINYDCID